MMNFDSGKTTPAIVSFFDKNISPDRGGAGCRKWRQSLGKSVAARDIMRHRST
jgi:hypothetical protein